MRFILLLLSVIVLSALVQAQNPVCYDMHILSRSPTPNQPQYGSFNWQAGGDYSGVHGGPGSSGTLAGFHFDGITNSIFKVAVLNNQVVVLDPGSTDFEFGSAGESFTFKPTGSLLTLNPRGSSAGSALDLNKNTVQNDFGLSGNLPFDVVRRSDGATYSGSVEFFDQLYTGDFNGAGFVASPHTFTIWLWGSETGGGTGYSFMSGDGLSKPLALDVVLSGEEVDCDDIGEANDCDVEETCDPELCNNGADCECTLHALSSTCATLCIDFGGGGSCDITVP